MNNFAKQLKLIRKIKKGDAGDMTFDDFANIMKTISKMQGKSSDGKGKEDKTTKKKHDKSMYG